MMTVLQGCSGALKSPEILVVMRVHMAASSSADLPESVPTNLYPIGAMGLCLTAVSSFRIFLYNLTRYTSLNVRFDGGVQESGMKKGVPHQSEIFLWISGVQELMHI